MIDRIIHGSAYYPEQRGLKDIEKEIAVMKKLGLNTVRMMEFAWSTIEPREGEFDFSLFDDAIRILNENGIKTILCTPTATPPRWFTVKYPESLVVDKDGKTMHHGSREHVCWNNADYCIATERIVRAIGEHFAGMDGVISYQIHNEPGSPVTECFCDACKHKWHEYLKNRYGTIENLNEKWDNKVWSFEYPDFESVLQPLPTPYLHSSSHRTCYRIFSSQSIADYVKFQADILREYTDLPLTTNVFRSFETDITEIFSSLDYVGVDEYSTIDAYPESTLNFELARSLCKKPYLIIETPPTSGGNTVEVLPYHKKGYIKGLSLSGVLGGGEGTMYWQFRQTKGGAEMPHGHVVDVYGNVSPAEINLTQVDGAFNKVNDFIKSTKVEKADVGIVYSDKSRLFSLNENLKEFNYYSDILGSYRSLIETRVFRDIITEKDDLNGYKLIYVPYSMYISDNFADKLLSAVKSGATVIIGAYSGIRTFEHTLHTDYVLGKFEGELGKKCLYYTQLKTQGYVEGFGVRSEIVGHVAVMNENSKAKIVGGYCDGLSAVSEFELGNGKLVIANLKVSPEFEKAMLEHYIKESGVKQHAYDNSLVYYRRIDNANVYDCFVNLVSDSVEINGTVLSRGDCAVIKQNGELLFKA